MKKQVKTWQDDKSEEVRQMLRAGIEPPGWRDGFLDNHRDPDQAGPEIFRYFEEGRITNQPTGDWYLGKTHRNAIEQVKLLRQYAKEEKKSES